MKKSQYLQGKALLFLCPYDINYISVQQYCLRRFYYVIDVSKSNGKPYLRLVKSNRVENSKGHKIPKKEIILK